MPPYTKTFEVRWADLDPNRHVRHTAYNDYATHVRFSFLAEHGFPAERFAEVGFGPVITREETQYFREVNAGDTLTINFEVLAANRDGSRFKLRHDVIRKDGVRAARVTVEGGWLNLGTRKLMPPPAPLLEAMSHVPRATDYVEIP